jgi:hypothetical protein
MTAILMAIEEGIYVIKPTEAPADYDSLRRLESIAEFKTMLAKLGRDDFDEVLEEFR